MSAQDPVSRVDAYLRRCFAVEGRDYSGNLRVRALVKADDTLATLAGEPVYVPGTVNVNPYEIVRIAREEPKVADVRVGHYGGLLIDDPHPAAAGGFDPQA